MFSLQESVDIYITSWNALLDPIVAVEQLVNHEIMRLVVNTFWKEPNED